MVLSCNTYDILSSGFIAKVNDVNSKMLLLENMFIYGQTTERYSLRYYITHNGLYNDSKSRLEKRFVCLVIVVWYVLTVTTLPKGFYYTNVISV